MWRFGAKVNNILVDEISFIEKLSFNAFNEGTRLVHSLKMHKKLSGLQPRKSEVTLVMLEPQIRTTARRMEFRPRL